MLTGLRNTLAVKYEHEYFELCLIHLKSQNLIGLDQDACGIGEKLWGHRSKTRLKEKINEIKK